MLSGDCNICINGKLPPYSATCVECGLSRKNYKPITNADRIRAMTDEELAEFLQKVGGCGPSFDKEYCNNINGCPDGSNCWLDWLRREVDDGT